MKLTKKLLALLLALTLVFSLFACGECTEHVDEDGNGLCDNEGCGAPVAGAKLNAAATATYISAVENTLEAARAATLSVEIEGEAVKQIALDADGNAKEGDEKKTVTFNATATITVALTDTGANAEMRLTATTDEGGESETEDVHVFVIDGILYLNQDGTWVSQPIPEPEDITAMIPESIFTTISSILPEDFEITEEDIAAIKATVNEALSSVLIMNADGSVGFTVDYDETLNQLLDLVLEIEEDDTLAGLIDPYLTAAGFTGGIETLLDNYALVGSVTVGAIYTALDNAIKAELDMGIADIYTTLISNTDIQALLVSEGLLSEEDLPAIVALDIDAVMESYKDMTVDDLLTMVAQMMSENETATLSVEQLIALAKATLTAPIGTLFPALTDAQAELEKLELEVLESSYYLTLTEAGSLKSVTMANRIKVSVPSFETDGDTEYYSATDIDVSVRTVINGFDTTAPTFTAPTVTPDTGSEV